MFLAFVAFLVIAGASAATTTAATASTGEPIGAFDEIRATDSGYTLRGWAADPDGPGLPVELHVYVNGGRQTYLGPTFDDKPVFTGAPRSDVAAVYPWAGTNTGFELRVVNLAPGSQVCVYAINQGAGENNTTLGCHVLPPAGVPAPSDPLGLLDEITQVVPGAIRVRGWAADPDAAGPMRIHLGVLSTPWIRNPSGVTTFAELATGSTRPDVAAAFPAFGDRTGFDETLAIPYAATYRICAWAINEGSGVNNTTLGCKDVVVDRRPFTARIRGQVDLVAAEPYVEGEPTRYRVLGWAADPRYPGEPVQILVRIVRRTGRRLPAPAVVEGTTGVARPDVAAAVPGAGPSQGFAIELGEAAAVPYWERTVAVVYAVDRDGGPDVLLSYLN